MSPEAPLSSNEESPTIYATNCNNGGAATHVGVYPNGDREVVVYDEQGKEVVAIDSAQQSQPQQLVDL